MHLVGRHDPGHSQQWLPGVPPGTPQRSVSPTRRRRILTPGEGVVGTATEIVARRAAPSSYRSGGGSQQSQQRHTPQHGGGVSCASSLLGGQVSSNHSGSPSETMCRLEALRAAERQNHEEKHRLTTLRQEQDSRHRGTLSELLRLFTPFGRLEDATPQGGGVECGAPLDALAGMDALRQGLHSPASRTASPPRVLNDVFSDVLHRHMGGDAPLGVAGGNPTFQHNSYYSGTATPHHLQPRSTSHTPGVSPHSQLPASAGLNREHWRHIFELFYERHNPAKVGEVEGILDAAYGREALVYSEMQRKYCGGGAVPPEGGLVGRGRSASGVSAVSRVSTAAVGGAAPGEAEAVAEGVAAAAAISAVAAVEGSGGGAEAAGGVAAEEAGSPDVMSGGASASPPPSPPPAESQSPSPSPSPSPGGAQSGAPSPPLSSPSPAPSPGGGALRRSALASMFEDAASSPSPSPSPQRGAERRGFR